MLSSKLLRSAFTPEVLRTFDETMDEVWKELDADGVVAALGPNVSKLRMAQKVMQFASAGRTDSQIKQLLLRTFRNLAMACGRNSPIYDARI